MLVESGQGEVGGRGSHDRRAKGCEGKTASDQAWVYPADVWNSQESRALNGIFPLCVSRRALSAEPLTAKPSAPRGVSRHNVRPLGSTAAVLVKSFFS